MRRLVILPMLLAGMGSVASAQSAGFAAPATVATPVLARVVEKGERLAARDFEMEQRSLSTARNALRPVEAEGMEATRRLMPGSAVRTSDLSRPQAVRRGEAVTIAIVDGPLSITTSGRALSGGGHGEMVRVVSLSTNRTLDAVVERAGRVRVIGH